MNIQAINISNNSQKSFSYKALHKTPSLKQLEKAGTKEFLTQVETITKELYNKNLHELPNVDIYLNYTSKNGFYGIISSKLEGTPNHPLNTCSISENNTKSINEFTNWAKSWDEAYSPYVLGLLEKFKKRKV
ncbi:hypothetical protein IJD34_07185 [bacterium]|nr:hypothetical protein [bacterium]